ncbi:MAG: DUF2271 domain-containing protein [Psychromonas sp.]
MKKTVSALIIATGLAIPTFIQAQEITFTTELTNYDGKNAYLAMYLTNAAGDYQQTLWVSGEKKKYYSSLRGWAQASGLDSSEYDGRTGATVQSGKSYTVTLDIDDVLIDSGNQIRIDSSVEHKRPGRDDVVADLTREGAGKSVKGSTYIQSFTYSF